MEERISRISASAISTIEQIKTVNKICSEIKTNKDYKIEIKDGKKLVEDYGVALKEFGII
jgi:hypothetical protein